jgi:hypothetical protein
MYNKDENEKEKKEIKKPKLIITDYFQVNEPDNF